jgi:hypothetical protein
MAQSIRNTIFDINTALERVFKGAKFYGVATSVTREGVTQPVVDDQSVALDDVYALQAYHKINGATITYKPGMGRQNNTVNNFSLSVYIFNNEKKTNLKPDEVAVIFQSVFSSLQINDVRILPSAIILNTPQIYATEYRGSEYRLSEYQNLIQINYSVEVTFKSGCFDLCPEDFSQCKIN